jgi:hypothetical protein
MNVKVMAILEKVKILLVKLINANIVIQKELKIDEPAIEELEKMADIARLQ